MRCHQRSRANQLTPTALPEVKRLADFDLAGRTYIVTGGAQGLGIALAEGLVEAGGKVYCLDRLEEPGQYWHEAKSRVVPEWGGGLEYRQVDVTDTDNLNSVIAGIAEENQGIHGLIASAGVQQVTPAIEYAVEDVRKMLDVNYTGVFMAASAVARQMIRYKCRGSICAIASISGNIANPGLLTPVYNSSKAAVIQLCRNLAMEWAEHGIRVNSLSPGHLMTPMVRKNFEEEPHLEKLWKSQIMMGRLGDPSDFKGPALFLLSNASAFVTGADLVVDGGRTAW
ncbi:hypothetical protein NLU13_9928 [Sarocladium strictum]|uniref:Uncharacterized protein n=1 Tax=Sarocladium strictum TaxID=5046 RepID=A0AA39L3J1_SARSR|nr:hypothetical protein NLU13_9928 [Sarocladium strictum]